jgi:hypothetical protein
LDKFIDLNSSLFEVKNYFTIKMTMSRQTDLSAFIAKKMNKNPEESQSLESKDTKKAGLQI